MGTRVSMTLPANSRETKEEETARLISRPLGFRCDFYRFDTAVMGIITPNCFGTTVRETSSASKATGENRPPFDRQARVSFSSR